ncbi:enoyl-CoA hydratase/isomerase family protein [Chloroflexota bacterium]
MGLKFEVKNRIAYITIDRPDAANAMDMEVLQGLDKALREYRDNDDIRAAIITGSGERVFSAGVDLKQISGFILENRNKPWRFPVDMWRGVELWKPLIAAINGTAAGAGLELALACDLRIASEKAKFSFPEVGLGDFPGWGGSQRLARFVSQCKAAEMLMLGYPMDAQEAYRIGMINKVVPPDQVMAAAEEWAQRLTEVAPLALKAIKESILRGSVLPLEEGLSLEWKLIVPLLGSEDIQEATKAFLEKRKPDFKGK